MEKNQATGLILIFLILFTYLTFFGDSGVETPAPTKATTAKQTANAQAASASNTVVADSAALSAEEKKAGVFAPLVRGSQTFVTLENKDVKLNLSTLGAQVVSAHLKGYKTYDGKPLILFDSLSASQRWMAGSVDLAKLHYEVAQADTQVVFTGDLGAGRSIKFTYSLPKEGFKLRFNVSSTGLQGQLGNAINLTWQQDLKHLEKDINQSRSTATVNFYKANEDFDNLSETKTDLDSTTIPEDVKWLSFKQKFFNSGLIAENGVLQKVVVSSVTKVEDTNSIKLLTARASIPTAAITSAKGADFSYYFGPNKFKTLQKVTGGYEKNVYLGYPVINWVNRYIVVNVFYFLESVFSSYGVIIIILVLLIKTLLFPLSYKSYISMAKMKVLKPELDEIKAKHGDDAAAAQQDQMKLYGQVGINPLSGCIPLLLQMPVLLAMFSFFPNSIELRGESFLWAHDLSSYDSIYTLPFSLPGYGSHVSLFTILMTASTLVLTWYNNQTSTVTGPMQSISYVMPVVFMFVLNSFPAGLNFYYLMSNVVSIGQQVVIRRYVDEGSIRRKLEENRVKNATKKKGKFAQRLEEAMRMAEDTKKQQNPKKK